jgi:putative Mn2+ efflux pump MntP
LVLPEELYLCRFKLPMDILTVIILAIGLSMDSFAVSISCGLTEQKISFRHAAKIAFSLAFFQGLFPIAGWLMGTEIKSYVENIDHWIAFILLLFLGLKMIIESFKKEDACGTSDVYSLKHIITLSIATSIDALVVGFSYALASSRNIFGGAIIIGAVTFFFAMLGIRIGKDVGHSIGPKIELLGGLILIGIGLKILVQHLFL